MCARECAGLRVVKNTLEVDRIRGEGFAPSTFEGVSGSVEIEILPTCIITEDTQLKIAEVMAEEAAADTLPRYVVVEQWKLTREGNRIIVKDNGSYEEDPDFKLHRPATY